MFIATVMHALTDAAIGVTHFFPVDANTGIIKKMDAKDSFIHASVRVCEMRFVDQFFRAKFTRKWLLARVDYRIY